MVIADPKSKVYSNADPVLTYRYTPALLAGDAFAGILSRATGENEGTYTITQGTLSAGSNYMIVYTPADLIIEPGIISGVTFTDNSFSYDGTAKDLSVTGLPSTATVSYTGNGQRNAGNYTVEARVKRANYKDLVLRASLIINKVPLLITAIDQSRMFGVADPVLTVS